MSFNPQDSSLDSGGSICFILHVWVFSLHGYMCTVCVCARTRSGHGGQKMALDPLELQIIASHSVGAGVELGSSGGAASALNH